MMFTAGFYHYNTGVDVTVSPTLVILFPPFNSTANIELVIQSDDIAHEYTEVFNVHLVLLTPLNETGVSLRESFKLQIFDLEGKFDDIVWSMINSDAES